MNIWNEWFGYKYFHSVELLHIALLVLVIIEADLSIPFKYPQTQKSREFG